MTALPGTRSLRQRVAFLFLAVGCVLLAHTVASDWPHEQTLIFRLEGELAHIPLRLDTSVTRVGEGEARGGMRIERDGTERKNPEQTLKLPDGDYVVTVAVEERAPPGARPAAPPKEGETTSVHRVTLTGGEVVVRVSRRDQ